MRVVGAELYWYTASAVSEASDGLVFVYENLNQEEIRSLATSGTRLKNKYM